MSVIISGSIAYDTVFTHEGYFADTLRNEALDCLNVTLQAASMRRTFGGCAANIAYSLKQLGGDPLVWTAVGRDAGDLIQHFTRLNIRKDGITVMPNEWTAQSDRGEDFISSAPSTPPTMRIRSGRLSITSAVSQ